MGLRSTMRTQITDLGLELLFVAEEANIAI
jgi:hypothetical protein